MTQTVQVSLESIQAEAQALQLQLSQEAINFAAIPAQFKALVLKIRDYFSVSKDLSAIVGIHAISKDQSKFMKVANSVPFTTLADMPAFCPEGLGVSYLKYLEILLPVTEHCKKIQSETLDPYASYLGRFLSDKAFSTDIHTDKKKIDAINKVREDAYGRMGKCFVRNSIVSKTKISKVIDRNSDWPAVLSKLNLCIGNIETVKVDQIKSSVKTCTDLIDAIIESFGKGADRKASVEASERLSNYAYAVAKELELYSTTYFRVLAMKGTIEHTLKSVEESLG